MYDNIKFIHGGKFFSRGKWKHPARVIDSTELIIAVKGTFYIKTQGIEYVMTPGDVLRLDSGVRHEGTRFSSEDVSFYWIHFVGANKDELPPVYCHPESLTQTEVICRQILHYANTDGYPRESTDCLTRVLIMELSSQNLHSGASASRIIVSVREWVKNNCDLPIKVSDIASHLNYNEDYLNRIFRQFYPEGLKSYIDEIKMQTIKDELINTSSPLMEIASKYSFKDYKYFLKYFKYHEGISPTKYRQMYYNTHTNNK